MRKKMEGEIIFAKAHNESFIAANSLEDAVKCAEMIYFPGVQVIPIQREDVPEEYQTSLERVERDQRWRQKDSSYWLIKNWKANRKKTNTDDRDWRSEFKAHAWEVEHVSEERRMLIETSPYYRLLKDLELGVLRQILDESYIPYSSNSRWTEHGSIDKISIENFVLDKSPCAEYNEIHRSKKTDRKFSYGAFEGNATHTVIQTVDAETNPQNLFFYKCRFICYDGDVKIDGIKFKIAQVKSGKNISGNEVLSAAMGAFGIEDNTSREFNSKLILDIEERVTSFSESRQAASGLPHSHKVMKYRNATSFFGYDIDQDEMSCLLRPPFLKTITVKYDKKD